ncbi:MAG: hypothetical protein COZ46_02645 [Verrucomicrobia bacterium CG_4_10_14_3_um_filter_43_23]|nr:MAG: hypothetical protein AUJ82_06130 [Verrucomicrobia bacterium CG1_02_43_26]PIP60073.1 MAG: hypothetical protein COX01_00505 [Verrucomicrobia bacterium CG22_combo_CG10-13_8_21_14_all_43_17]PIX58680.1 MAG: hypothetical protein COZ46_02645 [Verrucomicrobia bacterium CG_4_10_14_3_um_filter_43_23]PIY62629.1 MAG: hypothetical protein COY94_01430 [Verrucomicrobia bacterium CG_4_10_14_0_8_um_filter_43_34]PJA43298.1 MAG: hypothetical protein CO175_08750 [Verrucomicrobia bacterium CG_4_9_14_3_um_fi
MVNNYSNIRIPTRSLGLSVNNKNDFDELKLVREVSQKGLKGKYLALAVALIEQGMPLEVLDNEDNKKDFTAFVDKHSREEFLLCAKAIRKFGIDTLAELFKCEPGKYTEEDVKRCKGKESFLQCFSQSVWQSFGRSIEQVTEYLPFGMGMLPVVKLVEYMGNYTENYCEYNSDCNLLVNTAQAVSEMAKLSNFDVIVDFDQLEFCPVLKLPKSLMLNNTIRVLSHNCEDYPEAFAVVQSNIIGLKQSIFESYCVTNIASGAHELGHIIQQQSFLLRWPQILSVANLVAGNFPSYLTLVSFLLHPFFEGKETKLSYLYQVNYCLQQIMFFSATMGLTSEFLASAIGLNLMSKTGLRSNNGVLYSPELLSLAVAFGTYAFALGGSYLRYRHAKWMNETVKSPSAKQE